MPESVITPGDAKQGQRPLKLTAAICTWNRCESLRQTLEGFTHLNVPADTEWELLVVNNNCTDRTDDVLRSFEHRLPIRRAFEPTPGQSNARNRIVAEATGDYILWTDDDVTVSPDWLVAYAEAFRARPEGGLFGGPIRARVRRHSADLVEADLSGHRRSLCGPRLWTEPGSVLGAVRHSLGC